MQTLKQTPFVRALANAVGRAADTLSKEVIQDIAQEGLEGREEIITPQIARELTGHLVEQICEEVEDLAVAGIIFDVHCYKKSEENIVGADLAGVVRIASGKNELVKGFLAQAKVAKSAIAEPFRGVA